MMIERCEWCNGRRIGVTDDLDFDELARLRAENERLKAGARPYTVTCEPVIDRDWPEAHSVRIRNGGQRFDIGMHLETLEEAEHYATMLRVALGIDAAMTQGKL
jgi:hypothetical protein